MPIHPTALVDPRADVDPSAELGPYVVIEGPARIGARTRLMAHAVVLGWTTIGADNVIHPAAVIGDSPQDKAYDGGESYVAIGDRNVVREHVQIHRGTQPGSATVLGSDNFLMAGAHVGHNGHLGDHIVLANGTLLGGHVSVQDGAFLGGNCCVHQHIRIGRLAFLRGGSRADKDVPPFAMLDELNVIRGLNRVGLRRAGQTPAQINGLRTAFRILFGERRNLSLRIAELEAGPVSPEVAEVIAFIRASTRGVGRGPRVGSSSEIR